jgi:hypothetical protein
MIELREPIKLTAAMRKSTGFDESPSQAIFWLRPILEDRRREWRLSKKLR